MRHLPDPASEVVVRRLLYRAPRSGATAGGQPGGFAVVVCTRGRPALLRRFLDSLASQDTMPGQLIIVDASTDAETELVLATHPARDALALDQCYIRVSEAGAGVTRQRNLALSLVEHGLVASFDDDIVLRPGCLRAMVAEHRAHPDVVGVGACIENEPTRIGLQWRVRRALWLVPNLTAGRYHASGISTPWRPVPAGTPPADGDWLPGGAVMWKTGAARLVGYADALDGYGSANDLEFSLRMREHGRQVMVSTARVLHLQAGAGRPDPRRLAYEFLRNRRHIRRVAAAGAPGYGLWFAYAMTVEVGLQALSSWRAGGIRSLAGFLRGAVDALHPRVRPAEHGGGRPATPTASAVEVEC